jgi:phospholipid transport system substrate-binding protein
VTEATLKNGTKVDVIYRLFQSKKDQKWYIYDFSVENVSLLVNYRKTFASEISKKGMDQVIINMNNALKSVGE